MEYNHEVEWLSLFPSAYVFAYIEVIKYHVILRNNDHALFLQGRLTYALSKRFYKFIALLRRDVNEILLYYSRKKTIIAADCMIVFMNALACIYI